MKKNNFLTKAFTLLFVLLFNLTGARAIVTHTVYDGTQTNTSVPINGDRVGSYYTKSQFIIPSTQLQIMAGGKINNMIFYADEAVVNWYVTSQWGQQQETLYDVYVSETTDNTISALKNWSTLTKVYSGKLAVNGHQLIVDFTTPFSYSGENLLIGIRQTSNSNSAATSTFYGQRVNGASMGGYSSNADAYAASTSIFNSYTWEVSQQNFIPKTTFVYTPGFIPTNVNAVTTKTNTEETIAGTHPEIVNATVSWTGTAEKYEVRYRTKRPLYSQNFESGIPTTGSSSDRWTLWKKGDAPSDFPNGWGIYKDTNNRTNNGNSTNRAYSYSWFTGGVGEINADNWLISPKVKLGGILKFDADVSAWHDIYEVKIATVADIANADVNAFNKTVRELAPGIRGKEDFDLKEYQGQEGYIAIHHQNKDGYWISIDNFELSSGHGWKYATTTTNSVVLPRLTPYMEYEYVVIGIKTDPVTGNEVRGETANLTFTCVGAADIILPDDEDNEDLIYDVAGLAASANHYKFNAYLEKRSFVDNEIWNTLSLPFDVTVTGSPFEGALIYSVKDRSSVDNNTLTLRIDPLDDTATLKAGTPYLVTWEGAKGLYEPMFSQVTFKNETHDVIGSVAGGTTIAFKPNFDFLIYTAENKSILFLSNNHLYHVGENSKIRPQRGYFEVSGGGSIKGISFVIDEEDPTAIESVNGAVDNNPWYDLNGRKLTGKPAQKGIYINNGKKTIIK